MWSVTARSGAAEGGSMRLQMGVTRDFLIGCKAYGPDVSKHMPVRQRRFRDHRIEPPERVYGWKGDGKGEARPSENRALVLLIPHDSAMSANSFHTTYRFARFASSVYDYSMVLPPQSITMYCTCAARSFAFRKRETEKSFYSKESEMKSTSGTT